MRTPLRPLPEMIARWMRWARWLRWLDGLAGWLVLWGTAAFVFREFDGGIQATLAALLTAAGAAVAPLRAWWRPVSSAVALAVSRRLRPGDRAWRVGPGEAELVFVTARRGTRVVIAHLARGPVEGVSVRRTSVLLVPADPA